MKKHENLEAVAELLIQYDLATLLEGFEAYLEEEEPWLYNFLKDKGVQRGYAVYA